MRGDSAISYRQHSKACLSVHSMCMLSYTYMCACHICSRELTGDDIWGASDCHILSSKGGHIVLCDHLIGHELMMQSCIGHCCKGIQAVSQHPAFTSSSCYSLSAARSSNTPHGGKRVLGVLHWLLICQYHDTLVGQVPDAEQDNIKPTALAYISLKPGSQCRCQYVATYHEHT